MPSQPNKTIDIFPNPTLRRDYLIQMQIPEFTCLCPMTGQPDFAVLFLDYVPYQWCVELKSLKLFIWSFRDEGHYHEAVTNKLVDEIVARITPYYAKLTARFNVRGGIFTTVTATYQKEGWSLPEHLIPMTLPIASNTML